MSLGKRSGDPPFLIEFPDTDFYHFLLIRFTVKGHIKWNNLNIFFLREFL